MEEWQKEIIVRNLPELIIETKVNSAMKAFLQSWDIITTEEDERLTALGDGLGGQREAKELYGILLTRKESFAALLKVLKETKQSGALQILEAAITKDNDKSRWVNQLLVLPIVISGQRMLLKDIFHKLTTDDAKNMIQDADLRQEFSELLCNKSSLMLDRELPAPNSLYISRFISNRLLLDKTVFQLNVPDVFIFKGFQMLDLKRLVEPHVIRSSTLQRSKICSRHIFLDDEEDWDDLVTVSKTSMHLVTKDGSDYVLQRSTSVSPIILAYSINKTKTKDVYVTEDQFVNQTSDNGASEGALICDMPGMGKTWLLRSLARKISEKLPKSVVVFVQLSSFCELLRSSNDEVPENDSLKAMLRIVYKSKLASQLLYDHAMLNNVKIVFVLDGYDEINDAHVDQTTSFLLNLNKNEHVLLIISSRPHMRKHLEVNFKLVSYDILPFGREEQVEAIVNEWKKAFIGGREEKMKEFAKKCIEAFTNIQHKDTHDILGIPLKCYLLANVNVTHAKQISAADRRKEIDIDYASTTTIDTIADLYERFVQILLEKGQFCTTIAKTQILSFHTHKALEMLFPEIAMTYCKSMEVDRSLSSLAVKMGLISSVSDCRSQSQLEFIHRSFAEYFSGKFFADFWMNLHNFRPLFVATISSYFVANVLKTTRENFTNCIKEISLERWISVGANGAKISRFDHLTTLWLMDSVHNQLYNSKTWNLKPLVDILQPTYTSNKQRMYTLIMSYLSSDTATTYSFRSDWLNNLRQFTYDIVSACLDEGLNSLLSLFIQIVISFFAESERVDLLLAPGLRHDSKELEESLGLLLCQVAASGVPENAIEICRLLGNLEQQHMSQFYLSYPERLVSPLEIAIKNNDKDMVLYFEDKVHISWMRLFVRCLVGVEMNKAALDTRLHIMELLFGSSEKIVCYLGNESLSNLMASLYISIDEMNVAILLDYASYSSISLNEITAENKELFLRLGLRSKIGSVICQLEMLLFATNGVENLMNPAPDSTELNHEFCNMIAKVSALLQMETEGILFDQFYIPRSINCSKLHWSIISKSMSEDEFFHSFVWNTFETRILMCSESGEGKTWLMKSLAKKMLGCLPSPVIFFIRLHAFSAFLSEMSSEIENMDATSVIIRYCCTSEVVSQVLTHCTRKSKMKPIFFLDGFDEIMTEHRRITVSFLKYKAKYVSLILSSRPEIQKYLTEEFSLDSFNILPFARENRVSAVVGYWMQHIEHRDQMELISLAESCLDSIQNIQQNDENGEILGIPLTCYILSVIYENRAQQVCQPNNDECINLTYITAFESMSQLYRRFVEELIFRSCKDELKEKEESNVINFHTYKALKLLFADIAEVYQTSFQVETPKYKLLIRTGLLHSRGNSGLEFIHRSFAEYFAGRFLAEFWMNNNTYEPDLRKAIAAYFLQHVCLSTSHTFNKTTLINRNVLSFMNSMYQNDNNGLNLLQLFNNDMKKISQCRDHMLTTARDVLVACIDAEFRSVFSLLVRLLKLFVGGNMMQEECVSSLMNTGLPIESVIPELKTKNWDESGTFETLCKIVGRERTTKELIQRLLDGFIFKTEGGTKRVIQSVLFYRSDSEIIRLLLYFFGKPDSSYLKIASNKFRDTKCTGWSNYTAEAVLNAIDLDTAKRSFLCIQLDPCSFLQNLEKVETLKTLIAMCPDVRKCNPWKFNYQHFFAWNGKTHLLECLIQSGGYDINETDAIGNTPLLCLSDKQPIKITRLLVENGVNVYAENGTGENAAHTFFKFGPSVKTEIMCEWVTYMLEKDYVKLFRSWSDDWETPLQTLSRVAGKTHATTKAISHLLNFYGCVSDGNGKMGMGMVKECKNYSLDGIDNSDSFFYTFDSEEIVCSDESDSCV